MWRSFARLLTQFDVSKPHPSIALRNALSVAVPLATGVAIGMPLGGVAVATGALQVAYSDGHDPYSRRGFRMFTATVLCALAVMIGGLTGRNAVLATTAVVVWSFAAGMAVMLGSDAETLGVISLVTLIVYAAQSLTVRRALESGLLAFGGGLLQTGVSIALWPLWRYEPERRALANMYGELSYAASASMESKEAPPATAAMTQAQETLRQLSRNYGSESQRLWALLNQAERIRLSVLTLGRIRNRLARQQQQSADLEFIGEFLKLCAELLQSIAGTLVSHKSPPTARDSLRTLQQIAEKYRSQEIDFGDGFGGAVRTSIRRQSDALAGQLRAAFRLATNKVLGEPELTQQEAMPGLKQRLRDDLAKLQANLSLQSSGFRHAVRLAATLALGEIMAHLISARRSYWLPMTICLVLKPEFSVTFVRGLLRIAGTFLGLILTTAIFYFLHPTIGWEVVLVGIFVFLVRWIGPANYGLFAINVSALVVLLVAFTGVAPGEVVIPRALMTTLGGVTALAAYAVWPTWEFGRSSEVLARMLDAYRVYFNAVAKKYLKSDHANTTDLTRSRLEARRARSSVEALLDRLQIEPVTNAADIRTLSSMLASSHRFINAAMALEGTYQGGDISQIGAFARFSGDIEKTLELLARALRAGKISLRDLPDLREDHNLLSAALPEDLQDRFALVLDEADRVTNSLNTLAEQIFKMKRG